MKKILLVVTRGGLGGAQTFVANLAVSLRHKGFSVCVGTGSPGELTDELVQEGIEVVYFKHLVRTSNIFYNFFFIRELRKFIAARGFDVVQLNSSNALVGILGAASVRPRPRIVFTVHGLSVLDQRSSENFLMKKMFSVLFKFLLRRANEVVFVSQNNLKEALEKGIVKKGTVIYNGVRPLNFLGKEEAREMISKEFGCDLSSNYLLGSIGRLDFPKNYEFLINNFTEVKKLIPQARLVIIGDGPEREKYLDLIKTTNNESSIFLARGRLNAGKYLPAFDIFILPSLFEGLPMTVIEALMAKVPCLVTKVGGNDELLSREHLYNVNNQEEFLNKLFFLFSHQGDYVYKSNLDLSSGKMAEEYLKVFKL